MFLIEMNTSTSVPPATAVPLANEPDAPIEFKYWFAHSLSEGITSLKALTTAEPAPVWTTEFASTPAMYSSPLTCGYGRCFAVLSRNRRILSASVTIRRS